MKMRSASDAGALVVRRVLPAAVIVPPVLGWICLLGWQRGLYGAEFGFVIFTASCAAVFALLVGLSRRALSRLDLHRRQAEEMRFLELLESMPDAHVVADRSGQIVACNRLAEKMFGYAKGNLLQMPIDALLPKKRRADHERQRANYFAQPRQRGMGAALNLYARRCDGTEFPVDISLNPIQTQNGMLVLSAIRDITERKRIEQALEEKNLELQVSAEAKNRFLATMSHELRTPLNAIIGFTGTLLMGLPGPITPDQDKQLTTVKHSAKHLLSLINDMLDVARIEAGKIEINAEAIACSGIVEHVAATLRPLAERKGLAFEVRLPSTEIRIRTDRRALTQIVINLVNNAIKYTDSGSVVVTLTSQMRQSGTIAEFIISDTGCGIKAEDKPRLFRAFTQLDSSSTRGHEGTGLGLHLSQKLAEVLGARITCESEYGKGSTFTLSIGDAVVQQSSQGH